jgi:hypothetical protein
MAVDILKKLSPNVEVELLLTLGSPLAIKRLGVAMDMNSFPFDRVGAWFNFYDPRDLITTGRGVADRFPAATDLHVSIDGAHHAIAYLSNATVAQAVGKTLFTSPAKHSKFTPSRRLHPSWNPLLLQFAYTGQVSKQLKGADWKTKGRVDHARSILADRTISEAEHARSLQGTMASSFVNPDDPVAPELMPTRSDLLNYPADLVENSWSDVDLIAPCIGLLASSAFHPFGIEVDKDCQKRALVNTLNLIRGRRGGTSDQEMADALLEGLKRGKRVVTEDKFPWDGVLIAAGVGLLAITGVGLAVAVPAGLAGAAAITSALAAFGPGGMAGGIATIAALTGTGAAFTGAGLGIGATELEKDPDRTQRLTARELLSLSSEDLAHTLAAALTVIWTQRRLSLPTSAARVDSLLRHTLDGAAVELRLHREVADKTPPTREWAKKKEMLERALKWLEEENFWQDKTRQKQGELLELPEKPWEPPDPSTISV